MTPWARGPSGPSELGLPATLRPADGPPPRGRLLLRAREGRRAGRLEVVQDVSGQDGRTLYRGPRRDPVPNWSVSCPAGWRPRLDAHGGPAVVRWTT